MPRYVAFLRAINLGAQRKFPKDAIIAATEAAGGVDVATHINTGNVRLTSRRRSVGSVEEALEQAYAADRGFDVPTIACTWAQYADLAAETDAWAPGDGRRHYVTLLKQAAPASTQAALDDLSTDTQQLRLSEALGGRALHTLIDGTVLDSRIGSSALARAVGVGTTRDAKVIRAIGIKWA